MSAVDPTVQETASKDLIEKADEFKAEANKSFKGRINDCYLESLVSDKYTFFDKFTYPLKFSRMF